MHSLRVSSTTHLNPLVSPRESRGKRIDPHHEFLPTVDSWMAYQEA